MLGFCPLGEMLCWLRRGNFHGYMFMFKTYRSYGVIGICDTKDAGRDEKKEQSPRIFFYNKSIMTHVMIYIVYSIVMTCISKQNVKKRSIILEKVYVYSTSDV
jgi:hypothetical protein